MAPIQPQYPATRRWHPTWADVNDEMQQNDSLMTALELRVADLERALTDRRFRRQLRRRIRYGQRAYSWAGSWWAARLEVTSWQWLNGTAPSSPAELPAGLPDGGR
jgi:hypothetical protein